VYTAAHLLNKISKYWSNVSEVCERLQLKQGDCSCGLEERFGNWICFRPEVKSGTLGPLELTSVTKQLQQKLRKSQRSRFVYGS
jgi:hypothetical protein